MSLSTPCIGPHLEAFLRDELDENTSRLVEQHLELCPECQSALDHAAAGGQWWTDTTKLLSGCTIEEDEASASEELDLGFLQPTDDPRMLGRLGQHEVAGVIGCGGMGIVLKAFDASLNRYVALKVLSPGLATSGAAKQRFIREARAAASVVHDNVIAIHGVETTGPIPYLVMPYLKGESLQRRISREGPLELEAILRIGLQIAKGLAAAHQQGLIHRDIKPANVLLPTGIERIVLTDFGLARAVDDATLTRSGVIAGTPQYMSPEQAKGDPIDPRSDLFSLGSLIYAMSTGRTPFRAETPYGIIRRVVESEPKPISQINGRIPNWLSHLVSWLHAKAPAERLESAEQTAAVLEQCLVHVQDGSKSLPDELISRQHFEQPRKRLRAMLSCVLVVVLLTSAVSFAWPRTRPDGPGPPALNAPTSTDEALLQEVESEIDQLLNEP